MDLRQWFQNTTVRRFGILALLCLLLFSIRSMMNIVLLTFIFSFLMGRLHDAVSRPINRILPISPKIVLPVLYVFLLLLLILGVAKLYPVVRDQVVQLVNFITISYDRPQDNALSPYIKMLLDSVDLKSYIKPSVDLVMKVSGFGLNLFISLILSLFFLLEKTKVTQFFARFKTSKLSWFAVEVEYFGKKFVQTFGKVLEAQLVIALINCILTTFCLWLMGFPQIVGLALIIFVLGLIPVAGVIISMIPLSLIAFQIGGIPYIITLVVIIIVIHAIESYVLNPKLMSSKTHLPVFFTFLILIFSEHFIGIWGLIIGIPIVVFLLDVLDIKKQE